MKKTIGRGKKICPSCQNIIGARSLKCSCSYEFETARKKDKPAGKTEKPESGAIKIKRRKKKKKPFVLEKINWKKLQKDDIIKVQTCSGPYYIGKDEEKQYVGYKGYFRVRMLYDNAIGAFPYNNGSYHGYCVIYMGKSEKSELTGVYRTPHVIKKYVKV